MAVLIPAVLAALAHAPAQAAPSPWPWVRGSAASVEVSVDDAFRYNVVFPGATGGELPGDMTVVCGHQRHALSNGTLVLASSPPEQTTGADQSGSYDQVSATFAVRAGTAACFGASAVLAASIRYYPARDAFHFLLDLPLGLQDSRAAAMPTFKGGRTSWHVGPLPLSTEFPSLALPGWCLQLATAHSSRCAVFCPTSS